MNNPRNQPYFVTCRCQHCDGRIEFDASDFSEGETRTVECPHCHLETAVFVPRPLPITEPPVLPPKRSHRKMKWIFYVIAIVVLLMVLDVTLGLNWLTKITGQSWEDSNTVHYGDVSVTILSCDVGSVLLSNGEGLGVTPTANCFQIWVRISNLSQTRKIDFVTWRAKQLSLEGDCAILTDNYGNTYKNYIFTSPVYGEDDEAVIYPGDSHDDLVTFQVPVQNSKWLHLELPAGNFGGVGSVRFEIPKSRY